MWWKKLREYLARCISRAEALLLYSVTRYILYDIKYTKERSPIKSEYREYQDIGISDIPNFE